MLCRIGRSRNSHRGVQLVWPGAQRHVAPRAERHNTGRSKQLCRSDPGAQRGFLPEGGANYRVAKTVANGNWFNGNAQPLALGENTITVSAVSFARSVKFQFSSGDVGLSALALNGADLICGAGCTDDSACNYDDSATADDGSCTYPDSEVVDCDGNCLASVDCAGECGGTAVLDDCGVCGGDGSSCAWPT